MFERLIFILLNINQTRIADKIIQEHGKIFGIKKSLFYFLLVLFFAISVALVNLKMNTNSQIHEAEEYEEDEKLPEAVVLSSEPIDNENL